MEYANKLPVQGSSINRVISSDPEIKDHVMFFLTINSKEVTK